jgi:predicted nucleic acid-binding protein
MIAYIDSSIVLRIIFGENERLLAPKNLRTTIASEILKIECFRTLERIRMSLKLDEKEFLERTLLLNQALRTIRFIRFSPAILERACQPYPVTLKSLDAIHLSTALVWKQWKKSELAFLTHDEQLGKAATAMNFTVLGCK